MNIADIADRTNDLSTDVPDTFLCSLCGFEGTFEGIAIRDQHTGNYKITPIESICLTIEVKANVVHSKYLAARYHDDKPEFYYS